MSARTNAIIAELRRRPGEWVSGEVLQHAIFGENDCPAATANRLKQSIFHARRELPAGLIIETGIGLGYRIVGAGRFE